MDSCGDGTLMSNYLGFSIMVTGWQGAAAPISEQQVQGKPKIEQQVQGKPKIKHLMVLSSLPFILFLLRETNGSKRSASLHGYQWLIFLAHVQRTKCYGACATLGHINILHMHSGLLINTDRTEWDDSWFSSLLLKTTTIKKTTNVITDAVNVTAWRFRYSPLKLPVLYQLKIK